MMFKDARYLHIMLNGCKNLLSAAVFKTLFGYMGINIPIGFPELLLEIYA
jgi:hypothetical protein